jgi:isobutyryl-CoA mutase
MEKTIAYQPLHKVRIVTAASLFDGHDAAINIMRRIMQSSGAEIIHLGHNRSVGDIVNTAIQEDAQGIAITSYQGGHNEFFTYMYDLLRERGAGHIKIFGGGGGTILPSEIEELHRYGINRIYSPDDGRRLGLQGMINDLLQQCDFPLGDQLIDDSGEYNPLYVARLITAAENYPETAQAWLDKLRHQASVPILGVTGTGGAGKSSLVDELVRRFINEFEDKRIAVLSVDPSKRKTGGALLGDRIRMNSAAHPRVYMRSMATRQSNLALSRHVQDALDILKASGFDLIILETSGIGQSDTEIVDHSDVSLYVMTPEYGAATQLEKIDMLDFADVIAVNKFDKRGALDALRDVKKQYQRNHQRWDTPLDEMPVYGAIASQFNDPGMNALYRAVMDKLAEKTGTALRSSLMPSQEMSEKIYIIPPARTRYLSEISENNRQYDRWVEQQANIARKMFGIRQSMEAITAQNIPHKDTILEGLKAAFAEWEKDLDGYCRRMIEGWEDKKKAYAADEFVFKVRDREIRTPTFTTSLSHSRIPRVVLPRFKTGVKSCAGPCRKMCPENFPTPPAFSPSNARRKTPRACLPARAVRNAPTAVSTMSPPICRPTGSARPSTP